MVQEQLEVRVGSLAPTTVERIQAVPVQELLELARDSYRTIAPRPGFGRIEESEHGMKLGICMESTGLSLRSALPQAARWSVGGVQIDAVGDLLPEKLTTTGRRELRIF